MFTVGTLDNYDHDPSSTTAHESFHGTSISIFHFPNEAKLGINRDMHLLKEPVLLHDTRKVNCLLDDVANFPPTVLPMKVMLIPSTSAFITPTGTAIHDAYIEESEWLKQVQTLSQKNELDDTDNISWAAHHAN